MTKALLNCFAFVVAAALGSLTISGVISVIYNDCNLFWPVYLAVYVAAFIHGALNWALRHEDCYGCSYWRN